MPYPTPSYPYSEEEQSMGQFGSFLNIYQSWDRNIVLPPPLMHRRMDRSSFLTLGVVALLVYFVVAKE